MTSQVSQFGDQALVNTLSGAATYTAAGALSNWKPGDVFYNTGGSAYNYWNGTSWQAPGGGNTVNSRYLALLTADPVAGAAVNMSDAGFIECSTAGYARQAVTFGNASSSYPSSTSNGGVVTFTFSSTMVVPVQWAALVTVASGTAGLFLASWVMAQAYQVQASQQIQVGIGQLLLQGN